jgi:hypothetical protein
MARGTWMTPLAGAVPKASTAQATSETTAAGRSRDVKGIREFLWDRLTRFRKESMLPTER